MPTPPLSIYYIGGQNGQGPGWSYNGKCREDQEKFNFIRFCLTIAHWNDLMETIPMILTCGD